MRSSTPIHAAATVAHHHGALLKVILETALLTVEEKLRGAEIAIQAGADFIKTSTGFACGRRDGSRCGPDARRGRRTLRREGFGRHPHAGRCRAHARSRRQPHRRFGLGGDRAGAGSRVKKQGFRQSGHQVTTKQPALFSV